MDIPDWEWWQWLIAIGIIGIGGFIVAKYAGLLFVGQFSTCTYRSDLKSYDCSQSITCQYESCSVNVVATKYISGSIRNSIGIVTAATGFTTNNTCLRSYYYDYAICKNFIGIPKGKTITINTSNNPAQPESGSLPTYEVTQMPICTVGSTRCNSTLTAVEKCASTGLSWGLVENCGYGCTATSNTLAACNPAPATPTQPVETCGNAVCAATETYQTCPSDCSAPTPTCNAGTLNSYQCQGNTLMVQYQGSNCMTSWQSYQQCAYGCANNQCSPPPATITPPAPTCNDGMQNQDETGIDCGGSACLACPSIPTQPPSYGGTPDYTLLIVAILGVVAAAGIGLVAFMFLRK